VRVVFCVLEASLLDARKFIAQQRSFLVFGAKWCRVPKLHVENSFMKRRNESIYRLVLAQAQEAIHTKRDGLGSGIKAIGYVLRGRVRLAWRMLLGSSVEISCLEGRASFAMRLIVG